MSASIDFIDGYIARFIQDVNEREGVDEGLYSYYGDRVQERHAGMLAPEKLVASHLLNTAREVVHIGIGLGEITAFLAVNGIRSLGIERDPGRLRLAKQMRDGLSELWPEMASNYELTGGTFPDDPLPVGWQEASLLFVNVAGMSPEWENAAIEAMSRFKTVTLNLRWFAQIRTSKPEQRDLFNRIARLASKAEMPLEEFARFHFGKAEIGKAKKGSWMRRFRARRTT